MNREYFDICEQDQWQKELDNDPGYQQWLDDLEQQSQEEREKDGH